MGMLLGALDIGTQTTSLLAGEYDGEGLTVIGRTATETHGVRKGFIRDIDAVTAGIRKVRDDMDRRFGIDLAEVTAAISCFGLSVAVRSGQTLLMPGHAIDQDNVDAAEENAQSVESEDSTNKILQRFRQKYEVNGQPVGTPLGMTGSELVANILEISVPRTALDALTSAIHHAGLRLVDPAFSGFAAAEAVLDAKARNDGALVLDFGDGTIDYIAICNNVVAAAGNLAVGGSHLTNDLALAFQISQAQAEEVKLARGAAQIQSDLATDRYPLRSTFATTERSLSVHAIQTIVTERIDETFRILAEQLRDVLPHIRGAIYLTGGTAALPLITEQASDIFGLPCVLGIPCNIVKLPPDMMDEPYRHATAVGLLNWRCRTLSQEDRAPSLMSRIRAFLKG